MPSKSIRPKSERLLDREIARAMTKLRAHAIATRARHAETYPHYYVFYYPPGRGKGSAWKHPKQYFGPFDTKAEAGSVASHEAREYKQPRSSYKIKRLMPAAFEKIWGAAPGEAAEGY
jgi:hypothetical protein